MPSARSPSAATASNTGRSRASSPSGLGEAVARLDDIGLDPFERAQEVGARDDADEHVVPNDRHAPVLCGRRRRDWSSARGVSSDAVCDASAHDPAHRGVRELVADRLVEVLTADGADDAAVLGHEHAALPVALAEDHRIADAVVRDRRCVQAWTSRRGRGAARARRRRAPREPSSRASSSPRRVIADAAPCVASAAERSRRARTRRPARSGSARPRTRGRPSRRARRARGRP